MELERTIEQLLRQRDEAPDDSAERRMAVRQLQGLRRSYEEAGALIEDLDPMGFGN
jgi:hypothetical protein